MMTDEEMITDIKTKRPDTLWAVWHREPMLSRARELVAKGLLEEYYYVCRPDSGGRYSLPSTVDLPHAQSLERQCNLDNQLTFNEWLWLKERSAT